MNFISFSGLSGLFGFSGLPQEPEKRKELNRLNKLLSFIVHSLSFTVLHSEFRNLYTFWSLLIDFFPKNVIF